MVTDLSGGPSSGEHGTVTRLLNEIQKGNPTVADQLVPYIYDELRRLARRQLRAERNDHTLQTTALVHEAYLKFLAGAPGDFKSRAHFFAVASQMMRHILIDSARRRRSKRRGGGAIAVALDECVAVSANGLDDLLVVDEALSKLEKKDPRQARIVEMRFYVGLEFVEIAEVLGISARTVIRDWKSAQAWLYAELRHR